MPAVCTPRLGVAFFTGIFVFSSDPGSAPPAVPGCNSSQHNDDEVDLLSKMFVDQIHKIGRQRINLYA